MSEQGGEGGGAHSTEDEWSNFKEKVALSSATVLVFLWNHVSCALLCRAIPRVEGVPSATTPLLRPFSIYEDSKQGQTI